MRIVISDFISLDGVVQAPGGTQEDTDGGFSHGGWSLPYFDVGAMGPVLEDVMQRTEALLFGRRTWETMAAAWPGRAGDPFADRMNAITKYVASRSLRQADLAWSNSSLLPADDVLGAVRTLRAPANWGARPTGHLELGKLPRAHPRPNQAPRAGAAGCGATSTLHQQQNGAS